METAEALAAVFGAILVGWGVRRIGPVCAAPRAYGLARRARGARPVARRVCLALAGPSCAGSGWPPTGGLGPLLGMGTAPGAGDTLLVNAGLRLGPVFGVGR